MLRLPSWGSSKPLRGTADIEVQVLIQGRATRNGPEVNSHRLASESPREGQSSWDKRTVPRVESRSPRPVIHKHGKIVGDRRATCVFICSPIRGGSSVTTISGSHRRVRWQNSVPRLQKVILRAARCLCISAFCLLVIGCGNGIVRELSGAQALSITISPGTAQVAIGQSLQFIAITTGEIGSASSWSVNGVLGGNPSTGTVSSSGFYIAPSILPPGGSVTITAIVVNESSSKSASATITIDDVVTTISPTSASVAIGGMLQFAAFINGSANPQIVWSVGGVPGGNTEYGTISGSGLYTAPATVPTSTITVTATDAVDSLGSATATLAIFNPAVVAAHSRWLAGVAYAAAVDGCTNIAVEQQENETLSAVIDRFAWTGSEGSCLVLWPVSTDPTMIRYSLAWGGTINGKDILYISDISQMRIWNGVEVTGN